MSQSSSKLFSTIAILLFCFFTTVCVHAQSSTIFGPEKFTRTTGSPQTVTRNFSVQVPNGEFTLVIQNGEVGTDRVSSTVVQLNGIEVAGPDDFNQRAGQIIKAVGLYQT